MVSLSRPVRRISAMASPTVVPTCSSMYSMVMIEPALFSG